MPLNINKNHKNIYVIISLETDQQRAVTRTFLYYSPLGTNRNEQSLRMVALV